MKFERSSGILLHPTSLPGPYGIGDLGNAAYEFADFLALSDQHIWQILPLVPTGYGDSPYQGLSAFAGNTLLISPDKLVEDRFVSQSDVESPPRFPVEKVSYGKAIEYKKKLLSLAFDNYKKSPDVILQTEFLTFCQEQSEWLDDYALFIALKDLHGGASWDKWETGYARRKDEALEKATNELSDQIEAERFYQYLFFKQWRELRAYCNKKNISLVGDMPIFVAYDSVDVWRHNKFYKLNQDGAPTVVAGVPPDYFSATGQLWGNPLYNWEALRDDRFGWWIKRFRMALDTVDIMRLDHFRGFAACWEIPAGETTAQKGRWVTTPGRELFKALTRAFDPLPLIVEDLGVITPDVEKLRDDFEFPGMRILQMGFGSDAANIDLPHNYVPHGVVYTGSHDHDTLIGWFKSKAGTGSTRDAAQIEHERQHCLRYLRSDGKQINWDFIEAAFASVACIAIVPLQDVLGLGSQARMNLPASQDGNWSWRYKPDSLEPSQSEKLKELTRLYGRNVSVM
ncbi:MAG: 4-alpha-glucanotransferase [Candidatus Obscuribacterales bacterium]|nr:4-alpha-glucanotransferase [Candidatus Obscuribacterales bacterium]